MVFQNNRGPPGGSGIQVSQQIFVEYLRAHSVCNGVVPGEDGFKGFNIRVVKHHQPPWRLRGQILEPGIVLPFTLLAHRVLKTCRILHNLPLYMISHVKTVESSPEGRGRVLVAKAGLQQWLAKDN